MVESCIELLASINVGVMKARILAPGTLGLSLTYLFLIALNLCCSGFLLVEEGFFVVEEHRL